MSNDQNIIANLSAKALFLLLFALFWVVSLPAFSKEFLKNGGLEQADKSIDPNMSKTAHWAAIAGKVTARLNRSV